MNKMYVLTTELAFEIAENDLQNKMLWSVALEESLSIGDRWRVPTKEELNEMFRLHQKGIGNFNHANYWSSNGLNNFNANAKSFITGGYSTSFSSKSPAPKHLVRLVRNI